jgi:hypothetical protein
MSENQLKEFLGLMMCSDPWPEGVCQSTMEEYADQESQEHGYTDWITAYHALWA